MLSAQFYLIFTLVFTPDDATQTYSYKLTSHLTYAPSHVATLALIKRGPTLDPMTPLALQLHFLNHFGGEETPYESLHAVVSCGVKPWFDAFVGARGGGKEGDPVSSRGTVQVMTTEEVVGEANTIGAAFNRMVGVLGTQLETEKRALRAETQLSDSRELARWVDHHIEQERRMIARELHDELGQSVTAMRSMALSVAQRVRAHDAQAEAAARTIADEASRLYDAMHGLIPRLTPLVLDNFGLAEALNDLAARTRQAHAGVQVEVDIGLGDTPLGSDAALALYRAAQEGITNALRHGQATRLSLELRVSGDTVSFELLDDGQGLSADWAERPGHHGLTWLRERVESLGGRFTLEPASPRGVRLRAEVKAGAAMNDREAANERSSGATA